jgi:hypothetical protein
MSIADFRLAFGAKTIGNRQSQIKNRKTHPLPRGGTDFMTGMRYRS